MRVIGALLGCANVGEKVREKGFGGIAEARERAMPPKSFGGVENPVVKMRSGT